MHETVCMRERHGIADPLEHAQPLAKGRQAGQVVAQRRPAHQLHDVEQASVSELPGVVDRDDARVFEAGEHARFDSEPMDHAGIAEAVRDLDRHLARQLLIVGAVHRAHAAAADRLDEPVPA